MSKPNLLYYFRRKQDIYAAVLEETLAEWLEPFADIDAAGDPIEELRRYITLKLRMAEENPGASRLFANEILQGAPVIKGFLETSLKDLVDEKAGVIARWAAEGRIAPVDPYHLIFTIWATTQHYADFDVQIRAVLGARAEAPDFAEKRVQAVLAIILNGLRPPR